MHETTKIKCAASTNVSYLLINHIIWISGTIGLLWFSQVIWINLIIAVSYLILNLIFFHFLFGLIVCKNCIYKVGQQISEDEYLSQYTKKFQRNYRIYVVVWVIIGWIWPIVGMIISILIFGQIISLLFLIIFIIIATVPFLTILNKNVCRECKIRILGICPLQRK